MSATQNRCLEMIGIMKVNERRLAIYSERQQQALSAGQQRWNAPQSDTFVAYMEVLSVAERTLGYAKDVLLTPATQLRCHTDLQQRVEKAEVRQSPQYKEKTKRSLMLSATMSSVIVCEVVEELE